MKKRITVFLLIAVLIVTAAACGGSQQTAQSPSESPAGASPSPAVSASPSAEPSAEPAQPSAAEKITTDREGNPIDLPDSLDRIISIGPSNTEVLVALGFGDRIIASDDYSSNINGLPEGIPLFSMMSPDGEQIISLDPDVIFVTGMSKAYGDDPFKAVRDAGICLVYIPSSESIQGIKDDIRYLSSVMDAQAEGEALISEMESEIESVRNACGAYSVVRTVYFEIAAAPSMYSFGKGVFLNELLEIIGAQNIFADRESWVSVSDESILSLNPDVIMTSVNYLDDPIGEIMSRPGWDSLTAVQNSDVYSIDTDASNRPSHNIVKALKEMAAAVYPGVF